jgi:hypothetical protein
MSDRILNIQAFMLIYAVTYNLLFTVSYETTFIETCFFYNFGLNFAIYESNKQKSSLINYKPTKYFFHDGNECYF